MFLEAALRDLEHRDPRVRAQAADALGRVESDDERPHALAALSRAVDDAHPSVRYAALLSLGELAAVEAVDALTAHLDDEEPLCREAATIALGQLGPNGGARAWDALAKSLAAAAPEVRFQAIASLAEIDAARAAPLVVGLLDDEDGKVRAQAAAALGDAGERAYVDRLARLLDDVPDGRFEAALALARLDDRRGMAILLSALGNAERAFDAATAIARLGISGDDAARAELAALVGRFFGDAMVKVRCAEALARAGDERGLAHLRKAVKASRDDVRGLAESVLSELADAPRR
jgi:HEAT repeat protein